MQELSKVSDDVLMSKIYMIRGQKVMFDRDLAELYNVEKRALNQSVKRNLDRFPPDFMFQITEKEYNTNLKSQIVISSWEALVICLMLLLNKELPCCQVY
ncbi:MAG: DNA-binding protein [Cytophagaceae bacterium]|jgi:hypothetical protein|nr:DNA-binding protein [Cytophagaceae bacterium]